MNPTPRNFRLGVLNGLLYIVAETLMDPTLVLVAFLSQLTASPVILGLIVPLRDGGWALPQLWVSGFLKTFPRKIVVYRRLSIIRIAAYAVLALSMNFIRDRQALLIAFFGAYLVASLASGLSGLPFLEIVGKTVAPERRGEFFAWRLGLGGLLGIGASFFVRWMLDPAGPLPFPRNFGVLAVLYFVFTSTCLLLYNLVDEPEEHNLPPRASFRSQLARGIAILRTDRNFQRFLTLQSTLTVAGMATPFFAVYVQQSLGGSKSMVGVYLGVMVATNLLANIFFGRFSRLFGNRRVMVLATLLGLGMSALVLALALLAGPLHISAQVASAWLLPVFVLSGLRTTGMGVSSNSLLLDISPLAERSTYLGFSNTFQGIILLLTGLSGALVNFLGFPLLVAITLATHLLAYRSARSMIDVPAIVTLGSISEDLSL